MFKRLLDLFGKAPPTPRLSDYLKDSVVDWQIGDVAVCISSGQWALVDVLGGTSRGPAKGAMCKVLSVQMIDGLQFLHLKGWNSATYHAACFEKLRRSSTSVEAMIARHRSKPKTPERIDA